MKPILPTLAAVIVAISAGSVQAQPPAAAAAPPAASAAKAAPDCTKAIKPHDHGMERGVGRTVPLPCDRAAAASMPKNKPIHDHAKVHK